MNQTKFNITVASWPGTGSTTLALLLSYIYDLKYFYSGAVFRYFSEKLGYAAEGKKYSRNEDKYGSYLDTIVDDYSKILLEKSGYVIGTKPLGYLINRTDTFRIFLYADLEARAERSVGDGRESSDTIKEGLTIRQKTAGDRYKRIYSFDWENIDVLKSSHEVVLDTTNMSIPEEYEFITKEIEKRHSLVPERTFDFSNLTPKQVKEKARSLVKAKKLEFETRAAVGEIYKHFKTEVDKKPEHIRKIFIEAGGK